MVVANGIQVDICQWLQYGLCCRPLQRKQRSRIRLIEDMDILEMFRLSFYPCKVLIDGGCIDDEHIVHICQPINKQIINSASIGKAELCVESLVNSEAGDVVRHEILQKCECTHSFDLKFTHMAHVKQACPGAYGAMLIHNAAILYRHVPAPKFYELCS